MRALPLALVLVACGGPIEETLVDELRVVAAIPSTPEAQPGEALDVAVTFVEPEGAPVDLLVWLCTAAGPPGSPCVESAGELAATTAITRGATSDVLLPLQVPASLAGALSEETPELASALWVLACEPGLCPIIDEVQAAPSPGSPEHEAVYDALADPASVLSELPLQGVSASRRTLRVSAREEGVRNTNPVVSGTLEEASVAPGGELAFTLDVADDQVGGVAFGYATAGGFDAIEAVVVGGRVELAWLAPEEDPPSAADLLVVVQDGLGGEGLWRGRVRIDEVR